MIHVFHGFLGSPDDFHYLKRDDVIIHDLYENEEINVSPEDTLIGYSMGGRFALELAAKHNFNIKKLILISAHSGLSTEEQKTDRRSFENLVLDKLQNEKEDFLEWWNDLPIFFHDKPISITDDRFKKSSELFEKMKLSKQDNFIPTLIQHRDKVLWIVGIFDEKYMNFALEVLQPLDIDFVTLPGGHRLFQEDKPLLKILNEQGVL